MPSRPVGAQAVRRNSGPVRHHGLTATSEEIRSVRSLTLIGVAASACVLALAGCSSAPDSRSESGASASVAPPSAHPADASKPVDKVLVFVVENHSLDQMRSQMPYTFSLAERYGHTTAYSALTHPSLGNYIAIAGGSTWGIEDDRSPVAHPIPGPSVFSQALSAGGTAAVYAEGMPGTCALENGGSRYVVRHNPWTYFADDRVACEQFDVPHVELPSAIEGGRLPNVGMVVPDLCNDAHDCPLEVADTWLRANVERVLEGPDWRAGRLVVVITADEDDRSQDNLVLTTVLHPSLRHVVVDQPLSHLSLSRFLSEVAQQPPLRDAAGAPSLGDAFQLHLRG
jgi:phosphatidylinositol-3-phosphatase